jgi:hypothetical protein
MARQFSERGGHGVTTQLTTTRNTPGVFWSRRHNSFVIVRDEQGPWRLGTERVALLSINGIGQVRWAVRPPAPGAVVADDTYGDAQEDRDAAAYFTLEPA